MKRAGVVSIPCFAVKYYSCFTEEGSTKHSLIPNFWKLLPGDLYPLGVSKTGTRDFSVPKIYRSHIVTAYGDKVLMYIFFPFLHPGFHWKEIQVYGKRRVYSVLQLVSIWTDTGSQQGWGQGRGRTEEGCTMKSIVPHTLPVTNDSRYVGWKNPISVGVQIKELSGKYGTGAHFFDSGFWSYSSIILSLISVCLLLQNHSGYYDITYSYYSCRIILCAV